MNTYIIVSDVSSVHLVNKVNQYLSDGYILCGGISTSYDATSCIIKYFQAMAKP